MRLIVLAVVACFGLGGCLADTEELDPISKALIGSEVVYDLSELAEDGDLPLRQTWAADGTTVFISPQSFVTHRTGQWRVDRGRYCSTFAANPTDETWTCWRVRFSDGGARVRFKEIPDTPSIIQLFLREYNGTFVTTG